MSRSRSGPVTGALVAAGLSLALVRSAGWWPRAVREPMLRRNFDGREVTLAEGPAWVIGAAGGALVAADPAAALVVAAPGVVGLVDDLVGDTAVKGLAGHLRALSRGRVTSGVLKIGVLAVSAIVAATHDRGARGVSSAPRLQTLADAGVIAGTANLVNLFDLRPGRALKVSLALGAPLLLASPAVRPGVAAGLGATAGVLPIDLAGRAMLGDCGANASGALLGQAAVRAMSPRGRLLALGAIAGLTLLSERVSFSAVIEGNPLLRRVDEWGR